MSDNEFLQAGQASFEDEGKQNSGAVNNGKKQGFLEKISQKIAGGGAKGNDGSGTAKPDGGDNKKKGLPLFVKVAIAAATLVIIIGILLAVAFSGGKDEPTQQQPDQAQTEQQADSQAAEGQDPQAMSAQPAGTATDTRDYYVAHSVRAGLPVEHWAKAPDPIGTLTQMSVERAMVKVPEWNSAVGGMNISSDVTYAGNSFEFSQLKGQVTSALQQAINNDVQIHNDPQGQPVILERSSPEAMAAGAPEFDVIKTATAYDTIATNAEMLAVKMWSDAVVQARMTLPPPAPEAQPIPEPVDTGISAAQRNEYNRLLQNADSWQKELVGENQRLKEELETQKRQMVDVLQKIEDNPVANNNMRARMISTATNMKVQAVQGDLVFLEDNDGRVHSYRVGDALPGTDFVISNADSNTGIVYVTKK